MSLQLKRPQRDSCFSSSDELISVTVLPPSERLHRESTVAARTEQWVFGWTHRNTTCFTSIPTQEAQSDWRQCHVFFFLHILFRDPHCFVCVLSFKNSSEVIHDELETSPMFHSGSADRKIDLCVPPTRVQPDVGAPHIGMNTRTHTHAHSDRNMYTRLLNTHTHTWKTPASTHLSINTQTQKHPKHHESKNE